MSERSFATKVDRYRDTSPPSDDEANRAKQAKLDRRNQRERELGVAQLKTNRFGVIVADPPWTWAPRSWKTGAQKSAIQHCDLLTLDQIKALPVTSIAARDCTLLLWSISSMLDEARAVMTAWDHHYVTNAVWVKDGISTGYWFRGKHETLLLGTRGRPVAPAMGTQMVSAFSAPRGDHSAKPELILEMVDRLWPTAPKLEMFRRGPPRPGWSAWGLEVPADFGETIGTLNGLPIIRAR